VAQYLRRTKVANKVNVTFDYETELFVPVEDGEFVLISNGSEAIPPIVLPRPPRFATRRDFYEFYQDYYHCANPDAGEVHIIQPAAVARTAEGWKLQAPGVLEVLEDQLKKKTSASLTPHRAGTATPEPAVSLITSMKDEPSVTPCAHCGSLVETKYAFCWDCGNRLTPENEAPTRQADARTPASEIAVEEEELTGEHQVVSVGSPTFSWALEEEPERRRYSGMLKLIAVALLTVVLVSLGVFLLLRSASGLARVSEAQPVTAIGQSDVNLAPGQVLKGDVATVPKPQSAAAGRSEEDELKKLQERRIAATDSDRTTILQAFARTERQYPDDYHFPYERAKLAIKGTETTSHDEAFSALSLAAEKAINSGKAHEMLDSLEADERSDFHKLSHGHHEWIQLLKALKRKDSGVLSAKMQF